MAPSIGRLASTFVLALAILPSWGCGGEDRRPAEAPSVSELSGCWALQLRDAAERWGDVDRPGIPGVVRLDTVRLDPRSPLVNRRTFRAWSVDGRTIRDVPFHAWRTTAGDSLWVGHPSGAVTELRLALDRDTMPGRLSGRSGVAAGGTAPSTARLVRIRCPDVARLPGEP